MAKDTQDIATLDAPVTDAPAVPTAQAPEAPAAPQAPAAAKTITLIEGEEYRVSVRGFSFIRDFVSISGIYRGVVLSGIIGTREQFPISELKQLKGMDVYLKFRDTYVSPATGTEYNRFKVGDLVWE